MLATLWSRGCIIAADSAADPLKSKFRTRRRAPCVRTTQSPPAVGRIGIATGWLDQLNQEAEYKRFGWVMAQTTNELPTWSWVISACVLAVAVADNSLAAYAGRSSRLAATAIYAVGFAIAIFGLTRSLIISRPANPISDQNGGKAGNKAATEASAF